MTSFKYRPQRGERGIAIVLVLLLIVLLTGLVVAYFLRTTSTRQMANNSFNQAKVDELARSALDIITGDLKQEIVNGSTVVTPVPVPTSGTYPTIYQPASNAYIIPMQNWPGEPSPGATSTIPNLIRVSGPSIVATTGTTLVDHLASALVSTGTSANGRTITLARWNQHYLVPQAPGATDSTPVSTFPAPSWVFVTGSGPAVPPITAPSSAVIGRYAYAIYNEGGLLDMNVAGYPSVSGTAQYGGKGASLAYADLSQLTGTSGSPLLTPTQIDQIVGWRNFASAQASGTFGNFTISSGSSYANFVLSNTNSFMVVSGSTWQPGGGIPPQTDQAVLSRQELIKLQSAIGFPAAALQYMGTFSREVNAPTFYYPAAGTTGLAANTPVTNTTNVNILTLRMTTSGTANDGFTWNAGDPLVCRRFPLGRLSLVAYNASTSTTTAAAMSNIQAYFGLSRPVASSTDASLSAWAYVGHSGTTPASSIETLTQVAAETPSREPNFFELLKAAIHRDSLGVTTGTTGFNQYIAQEPAFDKLTDLQILRIGANIISQANVDTYPRVLTYTPTGLFPLYAYGIENLPYIAVLGLRSVADSYDQNHFVDTGATKRHLRDQFVPVLWNPQRVTNPNPANPVPGPPEVQLYFTGDFCYQLLGPYMDAVEGYTLGVPSGTGTSDYSSSNDSLIYGTGTNSRYNECGQSNFLQPSADQDSGSIIIPQTQFSSFANPNFILYSSSNGVSASGAYVAPASSNSPGLPTHTNGPILGLTLANPVYAQGREYNSKTDEPYPPVGGVAQAGSAPLTDGTVYCGQFDGYHSLQGGSPHHLLNLGDALVGLNVVLRYQDYQGNWQVYDALGCGEADPNGKVNSPYDICGIETTSTSSGQFAWVANTSTTFPTIAQATPTDPNWATETGTLAATYQGSPAGDQEGQNFRVRHEGCDTYVFALADPRTSRFGVAASFEGFNNTAQSLRSPYLSGGNGMAFYYGLPANSPSNNMTIGYTAVNIYDSNTVSPASPNGFISVSASGNYIYPALWAQNLQANGAGAYYYDNAPSLSGTATPSQSGVVRPGDDYFTGQSGSYLANASGGRATNNIYEAPSYTGSDVLEYTYSANGPVYSGSAANYDARPIVLNRPFRSVGELGYVFRDMPFKSLDMCSAQSVDAALLDFFTVDSAQTPLVAGKVDLNTRQAQVLQCVLNGSFRVGDPTTSGTLPPMVAMSGSDAAMISGTIVAVTTGTTGPFQDKANFVTTMANVIWPPLSQISTIFDVKAGGATTYPTIKTQREAPVRALADVANTRTWNLLIDVIAQTGQYPPGSTSLNQFQVTGERRYWLHVAIDRFTGKVVDERLEPVYE